MGIINFFKALKRKREEKRLAEAQAERERYQERKRMIVEYLKEYHRKKSEQETERYFNDLKEAEKENSVCPLCHSKNVVHHIVRTKGELHGDGSSYSGSSSFLFSHSAYSNSDWKIDGALDTLPVNKCNDCGHEWNIKKAKRVVIEDWYCHDFAQWLYDGIEDYLKIDFDPYDKTEQYNSLEEKQKAFAENVPEQFFIEPLRNAPRYMLDYMVFYGHSKYGDSPKIFGFKPDDDEYSYIMPDRLFEIVKRLIKWEGEVDN
jgi:hypothetical protein